MKTDSIRYVELVRVVLISQKEYFRLKKIGAHSDAKVALVRCKELEKKLSDWTQKILDGKTQINISYNG